LIALEIDFDPEGVLDLVERGQVARIEAALNRAMDEILATIALSQIEAYTADSLPPRPAGSVYQRSFDLRGSSRSRRSGQALPDISGEWYSESDYARYVLGLRSQQAVIHRGRWKSLEDVTAEAERFAPGIIDKELR
jgi:hypothetical protein